MEDTCWHVVVTLNTVPNSVLPVRESCHGKAEWAFIAVQGMLHGLFEDEPDGDVAKALTSLKGASREHGWDATVNNATYSISPQSTPCPDDEEIW